MLIKNKIKFGEKNAEKQKIKWRERKEILIQVIILTNTSPHIHQVSLSISGWKARKREGSEEVAEWVPGASASVWAAC
jgi:hypothetical protein